MAHKHGLQKMKNDFSPECDGAYSIIQNASGTTVSAGGVNLYPGDKAWYCGEDAKVNKLIKSNVLKVVEKGSSKPKYKKSKEDKSEETSATVAYTEGEPSVQLGSSEDDVALTTEQ